jgi:hypothetical protein
VVLGRNEQNEQSRLVLRGRPFDLAIDFIVNIVTVCMHACVSKIIKGKNISWPCLINVITGPILDTNRRVIWLRIR